MARQRTAAAVPAETENHATAQEKSRLPYPIVEAAAKLFRTHGFASVSMRSIAEAVGLSKAGLYHHCPSKEGLLAEMMRVAGELLLDQLQSVQKLDATPLGRLHAFLVSRLKLIAHYQDLFAIIWQERPQLTGQAFAEVATMAEAYRAGVRALIRTAQKSGEIRADIDAHLLMLAIDGVTGWANLWYRPDGKQKPDAIGEAFWSFLATGVSETTPPPKATAAKPRSRGKAS